MYLHLTVETTRVNVPAKALWIAAPLSEKQTVQSVLFPEGICYRKDIGFLHQSRMNWKLLYSIVFWNLQSTKKTTKSWMVGHPV